MKRIRIAAFIFLLCLSSLGIRAQSAELAATLEVLAAGVEVQRVNTVNWIPVSVEAIVGVGDHIRTDATGRARITFFANGVDTELLPGTTYHIQQFAGDEAQYTLEAEVLVGQTVQRINQLLNPGSSYNVETPTMTLAARGTQFAIRVEETGRAAMLVTEGTVGASNEDSAADVPPQFGIRAEDELSDVVRASTFDELDAALDGCTTTMSTADDVSINVRVGASTSFARVGTLDAGEITLFRGITEGGDWYRIDFRGGFGWILSSTAEIVGECAGLRVFPDNYGPEDPTLYESVGDPVELSDLPTPDGAPDIAPEATASPG